MAARTQSSGVLGKADIEVFGGGRRHVNVNISLARVTGNAK
jgi:hypothetical protein